ncbi:ABC transporter ATP-binding protein [bacterium]|nr:MAG: ABC transporter ATP-binding protein [bacterium]
MTPAIMLRDIRKSFVIANHSGGSLKTLLLWWKRRELKTLDVLKGLSLDVMPGECVAVVGRNGAGKSTLLALLARIYKPNGGEIKLNGRIAPLLELGAGFHPDLSGLENVVFNGIILGLTRKEIRARLDSIVAFSELGDHINAPARTYSSGMLARLGFAVAMHVDADILLVDEVLAVGDFEFERKCLARIREFKANGGTILLVSHQLDTIEAFADRCVWLENGVVRLEGSPSVVLPEYLAN